MVSDQEFMQNVRENTSDTYHLQAAEAFELLLNGEADADNTAPSVTMIYEVDLKRNNGSTYADCHNIVNDFWLDYMCNAILTFGSTVVNQRLIELLKEISKQPDVITPDGSVKMHNGNEAYWHDVPGWEYGSAIASDIFYYSRPEQHPLKWKDSFSSQASRLLNAARFAAMCLERGEFIGGLPRHASDFLCMGIEQNYEHTSELSVRAYEWKVLLPVAAEWLLIACGAIYSHCLSDEVEDLQADVETQAGWGGGSWTMQRWTLWKAQLKRFSTRSGSNDRCRAIAMQDVQKMAEVEARHKD